jgi:hypothetical protein
MSVFTEVDTKDNDIVLPIIANEAAAAATTISQVKESQQKRLFIVCDNCLWCASALSTRQAVIDDLCPNCHKPLASLRIASCKGQ